MNTREQNGIEFFQAKKVEAIAEIQDYQRHYFSESLVEYQILEGKLPDFCLVFTTARGAHIFDSQKPLCNRILKGKYYGSAKLGQYWFFARSNNEGYRDHLRNERISDICSVKFEAGKPVKCKPVVYGIPGEIHQMDVFGEELLIPHTDYNQLLSFSIPDLLGGLSPLSFEDAKFLPIEAKPAAHINSIFAREKKCYIVAHNYTWKTGIESELITLDLNTGNSESHSLDSCSAHNILPWKNGFLFCDSEKGELRFQDETIFKTNTFLRGLSVNENYIFVGGSDISFDQYERRSQNSYIYILKHQGDLVAKVKLPSLGDIYEIRQFEEKDFAMSQNS
jgi:hypothetical protein